MDAVSYVSAIMITSTLPFFPSVVLEFCNISKCKIVLYICCSFNRWFLCHLVSQVPHLLHICLKLCYPVYKLCLSLYSTSLKLLVNLFIVTSMNSIHTYLGNPCRVRKLSCQRLWYKTIEWRSSVTEAKTQVF